MNVFSRYLIRHLFLGFAAAAGLLLPLFTTFNLINELDDVSPGGYRWTQAVLVVLMTLPPFAARGFLSSALHWWRWLPGYCGLFR